MERALYEISIIIIILTIGSSKSKMSYLDTNHNDSSLNNSNHDHKRCFYDDLEVMFIDDLQWDALMYVSSLKTFRGRFLHGLLDRLH